MFSFLRVAAVIVSLHRNKNPKTRSVVDIFLLSLQVFLGDSVLGRLSLEDRNIPILPYQLSNGSRQEPLLLISTSRNPRIEHY